MLYVNFLRSAAGSTSCYYTQPLSALGYTTQARSPAARTDCACVTEPILQDLGTRQKRGSGEMGDAQVDEGTWIRGSPRLISACLRSPPGFCLTWPFKQRGCQSCRRSPGASQDEPGKWGNEARLRRETGQAEKKSL
ncbi:hypothetical protein Y1Q_0012068 [Alligator mississippiensis]|uniref:Uncharacterized protein n=1 Tax=Alligator mississippiensis TaxID=8496 RepID=A0A151P5S1_ALLMI|nr:hypothetical protein Y1Q_0012068 [Alligator mississippiensis]